MKKTRWIIVFLFLLALLTAGFFYFRRHPEKLQSRNIGDKIDSLNGVYVFYNGSVDHVGGRNRAADGYNLGLKYQCVEFVKRYYYQYLHHRMPDTYGNAKDFFDPSLADGELSKKRNLLQFSNPSLSLPEKDDLLVFSETTFNPYGHVAIVAEVKKDSVKIIQQNAGPFAPTRVSFVLRKENNRWLIDGKNITGWLRIKR